MSSFGTITSGLLGRTRPDLVPLKYLGESTVYQIPHPNAANLTTVGFQVSTGEEKRAANIIENQLVGISRGHLNQDSLSTSFVTFDGVFDDKSNHPESNIIISVSGIEAYINSVYVGGKVDEFSWSGLSHSGTNYLWLSLVEDPITKVGRRSSRAFRDFETISTTVADPAPNSRSVLVAAFTSGLSINSNPLEKIPFTLVSDHVADAFNPHGPKLFQDDILVSGINVRSRFIWDEATSGSLTTSGFNPQNITYLNNLTQFGTLTISGLKVNIHSGSTTGTFFENLTDLTINKANLGTLCITSGLSVSGSLFRQNIDVQDGKTVDGLDMSELPPLVSKTCLSGSPPLHIHSLLASSGSFNSVSPKYPNTVFGGPFKATENDLVGPGQRFEYLFLSGNPTLKAESDFGGDFYIRQWIPAKHNVIDKILITTQMAADSGDVTFRIRDGAGSHASFNGAGDAKLFSSGLTTFCISGISQSSAFQPNVPFDLEFELPIQFPGKVQYFQEIVTHYRIQE